MFFWGAATSSHQVEGGNNNDWTEWERKMANGKAQVANSKKWPDHILKNYPNPTQTENYISGRACDHYNRFREDFDIAKQLGHNAHRFSIEWSRIEPRESKFNKKEIEHYRTVLKALNKRGVEPFVTLWHFSLPLWLSQKNGASNPLFPDYFQRYTEKIVSEFKTEVKFWITMNEPEIYAVNAYLLGRWPPQKRNIFSCYRAMQNLVKAHKLARKTIKKTNASSSVGVSTNQIFFESAGGPVNDFLRWAADKIWNFYFLNKVRRELDFIGANYYFHNRINYGFNKNLNKETSDMGWEIYPEGIYQILKNLKKYNLPVYITENGVADSSDKDRGLFIADHLSWIRKAIREGADVRGYFHWSLLDNFEWDKGFWPRFGLVEVDRKTLQRKVRLSALIYKKIIEASGLNK
jgi:beta-glucosidase